MTSPATPATSAIADPVVGILGGTGKQGRGLAKRLADSGLRIFIGSRSVNRAHEVAHSNRGVFEVRPTSHGATARDLALVAVPYAGHADLPESVRTESRGR